MAKVKYTFSGHESFFCRSLWLKKGFDFVEDGLKFSADDSVVKLGVGKNMVSSIRYWMKAFGLLDGEELTDVARAILRTEGGYDPYLEDLGTLWLLHYMLVTKEVASIYNLAFLYFKKERNGEFTKEQLQLFVRRKCDETGNSSLYNENTVKRDVGVFLQNYVTPNTLKSNEDFAALLLNLNLIKQGDKSYYFNDLSKSTVIPDIFLYAILDRCGSSKSISFDELMDVASIFCMTKTELIDMLMELTAKYTNALQYSDNSGVRQLLFLKKLNKNEVLNQYYRR